MSIVTSPVKYFESSTWLRRRLFPWSHVKSPHANGTEAESPEVSDLSPVNATDVEQTKKNSASQRWLMRIIVDVEPFIIYVVVVLLYLSPKNRS